jgi:hypothetical protein
MTHTRPFWALSLLLLVVFSTPITIAETFRNPYRIPTPVDPGIVAAGDLNGDGVADFVWEDATTTPATLNVLLSQPNGGWLPGVSITYPGTRGGVCSIADLNNDTRNDLICASADQFTTWVNVFLGNGDGTLQPPVATDASFKNAGNWADPAFLVVGDLNGDGFADLYEEDALNQRSQVMLSDGKGGFKALLPVQTGINGIMPDMSADVNGDGIPDLLFPFGPEVALGKGDGTFGPVANYSADSYYAATCVFHDMDGDGHLDAICGYEESTTGDITGASDLIILHGNPDGSFNTTPIAKKTFGNHGSQYDGFGTFQGPIFIADMNGDGVPDVIGSSGDGIAVLMGGRNLTFSAPLHYAQSLDPVTGIFGSYQWLMIDVNGDGIPDAVSVGPHGLYISYGQRDGSFTAPFAPEVTGTIGFPTVADFNGDGIPDVAATGDPAIMVSFGKGDGTFSAPVALPNQSGAIDFSTPLSPVNAHILHGDFNGDGKVDLLAIGSSSIYQYDSYILFGNGDGTFQEPVLVPDTSVIYPMYSQLSDAVVYDINHDGRSDVVTTTVGIASGGPAQILAAFSKGDGTFNVVSSLVNTDVNNGYTYISPPALADFDSDGELDVVYGSYNHVFVAKGFGDGTFGHGVQLGLPIPPIAGVSPQWIVQVVTGDFDGDGKQDFAALVQYGNDSYPYSAPNATAIWIYYSNGHAGFSLPVLAATFDRYYTNLAVSDLNRDGLSDFLVKTSGTLGGGFAVGIVHGRLGRTFGPEVNYIAGTGLAGWDIVDLNRDGFPDIVIGNGDYNIKASSVTVLLNLGNTPTVTGTLTATPEPSLATQSFTLTASLLPPVSASLTGNVAFFVDGKSVGANALSGNRTSITIHAGLSIGSHSIAAQWAGDSTYPETDLTGTHLVVADPTKTTITSSKNPASVGVNVTFTSTVTSSYGNPTGTVTFTDNGNPLKTVTLAAGTVALSTSSLTAGTHTIQAAYSGDATFASSNASLTENITAEPTSISLSAAPNPAYVNQAVVLSALVTATNGTPTGTVTFYDGTTAIGSASLNASGAASLTASFSSVGTHPLTAKYSGDASFGSSVSPEFDEKVILNPSTTTLQVAPNPAVSFFKITLTATVASTPPTAAPSGTIIFSANGVQLGTATLQSGAAIFATSSLSAGTYLITAAYGGNPAIAASTSSQVTLVVNPRASSTALTSSANPSVIGARVTFTATVSATGPSPTGTVQFFDGANALGAPASLNAAAVATYTTSTLSVGKHSITAAYSGDNNTQSSRSPALTQSVISYAGDFSIAVDPTSASLYTGQRAVIHVTVTSRDGFNEPVELSCANLPAESTCAFSPASFSSGQGTATVTIQTAAPHRDTAGTSSSTPRRSTNPLLLAVVGLFLLPIGFKRRRLFVILLAAFTFIGIGACGANTPISGGTPPGTYSIQVTGAYTAPNPQLQHSAQVKLKVKSLF